MAKDPAFLFYSQDFIIGCQTLNMEERGQYITLISMMHQQGRMDEETIRLLVGSVSVRLLAKFQQDEHGKYYSKRLEKEVFARKNFVESRRINGAKGGKPKNYNGKKQSKPIGKPNGKLSPPLMEDVDVNENVDVIKEKGVQGEKPETLINMHPFSPGFIEHWERWIKFRKVEKRKFYKSIETEQTAFKKLVRISGNNEFVAEKIIDESISYQWEGLFPLKDDGSTPKEKRIGRMAESCVKRILETEIVDTSKQFR